MLKRPVYRLLGQDPLDETRTFYHTPADKAQMPKAGDLSVLVECVTVMGDALYTLVSLPTPDSNIAWIADFYEEDIEVAFKRDESNKKDLPVFVEMSHEEFERIRRIVSGHVVTTIFCYGTLMSETVYRQVLGDIPLEVVDADLDGYQRLQVRNQLYPAIIPNETSSVHGKLLNVPAEDLNDALARLDAFEGVDQKLYKRIPVTVTETDTKKTCDAWTYVWDRSETLLDHQQEWTLEKFMKRQEDFINTESMLR